MSELRFALLGAGGQGAHHARLMRETGRGVLAALCDANEAVLQRRQEEFGGVRAYRDLEALLAGEKLDAVVIATPHTQHYEQVKRCLEHGLHVLSEKPLATTAAHARALAQLAADKGRILAIAYQRHGDRLFRTGRKLLQEGVIGEIKLTHSIIAQDCLANFIPGRTWRADPALSGGGHLMDTGSHVIDILLWMTGLEPKRVHAFINQHETHVDVLSALSIEYTNGAVGTLAATSLSPEWREEHTFYGTEGTLYVRGEGVQYRRFGEEAVTVTELDGAGQPPILNFIDAVQKGAEVQAPAVCGIRVAQLTNTAYRSAESGRVEDVG
ncbi:MAG TPA: Gfo/Idh/MocA family oxidoreductase [Limnochordia bacterium]|nr:Gfo/Idh/MocA family oxidoreductase [Limnochordia bacterium]